MSTSSITYSPEDLRIINKILYELYDDTLSLREIMDTFMSNLREEIYFDKRDFTMFAYNEKSRLYEIRSFYPANWTDTDQQRYINNYIHLDDVLPILAISQEVAFRNNDIFSEERKKTLYYKEFLKKAQLEISIDANIPLAPEANVFAAFALYRNTGMKEFSEKDLAIVKLYQKHLSRIFNRHFSKNTSKDSGLDGLPLSSINSFGVCTLDENFNFETFNSFFKKLLTDKPNDVSNSSIGKAIIGLAKDCAKLPEGTNPEPVYIDVDDRTYLLELSRFQQDRQKYMAVLYPLSDFVQSRLKSLKDTYQLSAREFEILNLILKNGMTNDEIAEDLFISPATVKRHISNAYNKLGINTQKQLLSMLKII